MDVLVRFLADANLPHYTCTVGYLETPVTRRAAPYNMRALKKEIIQRFQGDIGRCNEAFGTEFPDWNSFG